MATDEPSGLPNPNPDFDPDLDVPSAAFSPASGFVSGPENALAQASVLALARGGDAAGGLSPLVLHGPSGVGKSRLLAALVAECLRCRPGASVAHLEAEAFATACAEAAARARSGGWAELRERFRGLDLFVLEDLHALERAPLALNELAHTLDALDAAGASLAFSARSGPGQWLRSASAPGSGSGTGAGASWPPRLVNRLVGGLAVRVDPPGIASRRRYVLDRSRARGLALSAGAVEALARAGDGYRTLDGWLARLGLLQRLGPRNGRRPLGPAEVEALLAEGSSGSSSSATVEIGEVARAVAERFGVRLGELRAATRRPSVVGPRHLAMHLARDLTGRSFRSIGDYFGRRDPATVRHACRAAAARLEADPALAAAAASIRRRWPSPHGPADADPGP